MAVAEHRFRAMGGGCHVVAVAGSLARARRAARDSELLLLDLEARWSRFRGDSEIARLNGSGARAVDADTFDVVSRAVAAWHATGGRFDPTVEPAVAALGYDRSYELVGGSVTAVLAPAPAPGCAGIELDPGARSVTLPAGTRLDLGAIGKGRAADLVAERLDADGACVNVGGDLRVRGTPPGGREWVVAVESPGGADTCLSIADGGVATSSPAAKAWRAGDRLVHHVVDPRTGLPATTDVASATVVAGEAWWAEVLATCALLAGSRAGPVEVDRLGGATLLHLADGARLASGSLRPFLAEAS